MPNIKIYQHRGDDFFDANESPLKSRIDQIMQELRLGDDAITVVIDCMPESCDGKRRAMPFIRVCSPNIEEIEKIVSALKQHKIGVDTETLVLERFIEADEMK